MVLRARNISLSNIIYLIFKNFALDPFMKISCAEMIIQYLSKLILKGSEAENSAQIIG